MEDFVTYKQAKLLKELGFNWECTHYYQDGYNRECQKNIIKATCACNFNEDFKTMISAPTLAQAQKWLREVKRVKILITVGDVNENRYGWQIFYNNNHYVDLNHGNSMETYEEALLDSIDEALELLKEQ